MTRASKPPVALYSALADVTRCRILEILRSGPVPVHRLSDSFSISRPAISRHLRVLKQAGLVTEVKKGRENLYAFRPRRLELARDWLLALSKENTVDEAPEAVVEPAAAVVPVAAPVPAPEPVVAVRRARMAPPPPAQGVTQMGFDF